MKFALAFAIGGAAVCGLIWLYKKMEEAQEGDEPKNNDQDQSNNHFI
jgi:hypothetical protein